MKKLRKFTAFILCLTLIIPFITTQAGVLTARAAETFTEGIFTYTVTDGNATITKIQPDNEALELIIPSTLGGYPVTTIGARAVTGYSSQIKTITVSEGITTIMDTPFAGLLQAEELHLPASLTTLSYTAFGPAKWKSITVPEESTFLTVADGALLSEDKTILYKCFYDENSDTYTVGDYVKILSQYSFYGLKNLRNIHLPEGLTEIGDYAFYNCENISSYTIPSTVTYIGTSAFLFSLSATHISVPESNTAYSDIDGVLFNKNGSTLFYAPGGKVLGDYTIPETVTSIETAAFHTNNALTKLTFPESMKRINLSSLQNIMSNTEVYVLNPDASFTFAILKPQMSYFTFYGYSGSTTQTMAEENSAAFVALDAEEETTTEEETTEEETTEDPAPPFESSFSQGDIIEFGMYPQTLVTDEALAEELSWYIEDYMWQSLGWFRGTGSVGTMYETDAGKYCDIDYYGEKYRAVTFSENRAYESFSKPTATYQQPLGYIPGEIYYFKFEPVKWRILDPANGLVIAESVLDAPAFSNYAYPGEPEDGDTSTSTYYYADSELTHYSSNWEYSSLRSFLNTTFADTAFSEVEKSLLGETELENTVVNGGNEKFSGNNTTDKVFILSTKEIGYDEYYGLSNTLRTKNGTDYAHMHGLFAGTKNQGEAALYYLRDAANSGGVAYVSEKGVISSGTNAFSQDIGVVPSMCIDLESYEKLDLYKNLSIEFNNGVLTVSGEGALPDRTKSVTDVLSPYTEITKAVIIEDGITEISTNAFKDFIELRTVILEGKTVLADKCLPDSFQLSTMIFKDEITLQGNPFAPDIFYVNIFVEYGLSYSYEYMPEGVNSYTYLYKDSGIEINGNITMNTYEFLDFTAAMCEDFDNVEHITFNRFTSTDLAFYRYNKETGKREMIPDSTISDVIFSIEVSENGSTKKVSFNTLCEMAANGTLEEFWLITESKTEGDIDDTEMEINSLGDIIEYALKWIVSLLNFFFSLFSRF